MNQFGNLINVNHIKNSLNARIRRLTMYINLIIPYVKTLYNILKKCLSYLKGYLYLYHISKNENLARPYKLV